MIIAKYITSVGAQNACLLAMDSDIFQKDVAIASAANCSAIFPQFHALTRLWTMLNKKVC
jgi:hypothetical protein